jgi:cell division protein FtsQ
MNKKIRNILIKLSLLLFFGTFFTLTVLSAGFGKPTMSERAEVAIDYSRGHFFVRPQDVEEKIDEYFRKVAVVDAAQLKRLEGFLAKLPHVRGANAFIDSKGVMHVSIEQRNPKARVISAEFGNFYIDEDGLKFPVSPFYTAKVPLITGAVKEGGKVVGAVETPELADAVAVIDFSKTDAFWSAQVAEVHIGEKGKLSFIPRMGNHLITIGDVSALEDKFRRISLFYKHVLNVKGWDAYTILDVQFQNQIVCK